MLKRAFFKGQGFSVSVQDPSVFIVKFRTELHTMVKKHESSTGEIRERRSMEVK